MLNKIMLMGRMVKDPELRQTASGTSVATFTIAVDRNFTQGEKQVDFFDVVAWNAKGETIAKHFKKGNMIAVVGSVQFREWTDKEGNKRRNAEVILSEFYFCERKTDAGEDVPKAQTPFSALTDEDGDLPF